MDKIDDEELSWACRFHPVNWFHEVGCPHMKCTKKQLQKALETSKKSYSYAIRKWRDAEKDLKKLNV